MAESACLSKFATAYSKSGQILATRVRKARASSDFAFGSDSGSCTGRRMPTDSKFRAALLEMVVCLTSHTTARLGLQHLQSSIPDVLSHRFVYELYCGLLPTSRFRESSGMAQNEEIHDFGLDKLPVLR
jgi:hypothetical protein